MEVSSEDTQHLSTDVGGRDKQRLTSGTEWLEANAWKSGMSLHSSVANLMHQEMEAFMSDSDLTSSTEEYDQNQRSEFGLM